MPPLGITGFGWHRDLQSARKELGSQPAYSLPPAALLILKVSRRLTGRTQTSQNTIQIELYTGPERPLAGHWLHDRNAPA
jgi:hypothetical protein